MEAHFAVDTLLSGLFTVTTVAGAPSSSGDIEGKRNIDGSLRADFAVFAAFGGDGLSTVDADLFLDLAVLVSASAFAVGFLSRPEDLC